jgi:hypothetical protein
MGITGPEGPIDKEVNIPPTEEMREGSIDMKDMHI